MAQNYPYYARPSYYREAPQAHRRPQLPDENAHPLSARVGPAPEKIAHAHSSPGLTTSTSYINTARQFGTSMTNSDFEQMVQRDFARPPLPPADHADFYRKASPKPNPAASCQNSARLSNAYHAKRSSSDLMYVEMPPVPIPYDRHAPAPKTKVCAIETDFIPACTPSTAKRLATTAHPAENK